MKSVVVNLVILLITSVVFISCTPEQAVVDYGMTAKPMAGADANIATDEDEEVRFSYTIKDTALAQNAHTLSLELSIYAKPEHGTLEDCNFIDELTIDCLYKPKKDYFGSDRILFKSKDGDFYSANSSQMSINIRPIPDNPVAAADQIHKIAENSVLDFELSKASDVDSKDLEYSLMSDTQNGTIECFQDAMSPMKCRYTPDPDFYGVDSFSYMAKDETDLRTNENTEVRIYVKNYPEIGSDSKVTVNQYSSVEFEVEKASDYDTPDAELKYIVKTNPQNGDLSKCFTLKGQLSCVYTPVGNYYGNDSFTYAVVDEFGLESLEVATVNIEIIKVNVPPKVGEDQNFAINQDELKSFEVSIGSDKDSDLNLLQYKIFEQPKNGVLSNCFATAGERKCTYTPNQFYYGNDEFKYKIVDETNVESLEFATVRFTMNKKPQKPRPQNDQFDMRMAEEKKFIVTMAIDADTDANKLNYKIEELPKNGILTDCFVGLGGRACTYIPDKKFYGLDFFTYHVLDDQGNKSDNVGRVDFNVVPRSAPVAGKPIQLVLEQYQTINFTVPEGIDTDTDLSKLSYKISKDPTLGDVELRECFIQTADRNCKYRSNGIVGDDVIEYLVEDEYGLTSDIAGVVNLKIIPRNKPEPHPEDVFKVTAGNVFSFNVSKAYSPYKEENLLQYVVDIANKPKEVFLKNCFLSRGNTSCQFVPEPNFYGEISFEYKVVDQFGIESDPAKNGKVKFIVEAKKPPLANYNVAIKTQQNVQISDYEVGPGTDEDTPPALWPSSATFTILEKPTNGVLVNCFAIKGDRKCTYIPNSNYYGNDKFTYKVTDMDNLDSTDIGVVNIEVEKVNKKPRVGRDDAFNVDQNTTKSIVVQQGTDPDHLDTVSEPDLFYIKTSETQNGVLSNCLNDNVLKIRTCRYTPNLNYYGPDSFTYKVKDPEGLESDKTATVYFNVVKVDEKPRIGDNQTETLLQGTEISFSVNEAKDIDPADKLTYSIVTPTKHGAIDCFKNIQGNNLPDLRNCHYIPSKFFYGVDEFSYRVTDTSGNQSGLGKVTLVVNRRQLPVCQTTPALKINQNAIPTPFNITAALDVDTDANLLSYTIVNNPTKGKLTNCFQGLGNTSCEYKPNDGFYGSDVFSYKVIDDYNNEAESICYMSIGIEKINRAPVIGPDQLENAYQNKEKEFALNKAFDPDDLAGDKLKYIIVTQPSKGRLENCAKDPNTPGFMGDPENRACKYIPNPGYYGPDTFTYKVKDENGFGLESSKAATVTINVLKINTPPVVGADQLFKTEIGKPRDFIVNSGTDAETSATRLRYRPVTLPKNGSLSSALASGKECFHNATSLTINNYDIRNCKYTPNPGYYGTDSFTYEVLDDDNSSSAPMYATVTFEIERVFAKPIVKDHFVALMQDTQKVFDVPMATDFDSVAGDLEYFVTDQPKYGTLECFKDGMGAPQKGNRNCIYTPFPGFNGLDTAFYSARDEGGRTSERKGVITFDVGGKIYAGVEVFQQYATAKVSKVDITWVIDNSGSMKGDQNNLKNNFSSFIDKFLLNGKARYPFKMNMTTTDAKHNSTTDLSWNLAEANFTQFKSNFETAVLVGTGGSGSEKALQSLDSLHKENATFFGGNDTLQVYVIVSDEAEQSTSKTIPQWAFQFQSLKDNPAKVRFYPIIIPGRDANNRYMNLAQTTGGQVYDIEKSFDGILDNISTTITTLLDSYLLKGERNIIPDTIKVYVNDVPMPNGWTYGQNSIKFQTPPPQNATIRVEYDYTTKYVGP